MLNIIQILADAIFPPRPDALLLRHLSTPARQSLYHPIMYRDVVSLSEYSSPLVRALIHENKYYKSKVAATTLASLLQTWVAAQTNPSLLVAIPLSSVRYRERGYNQVAEIFAKLIPSPHLVTGNKILIRTKDTASQTSLSREQRLKNVSGVFRCEPELLQLHAGLQIVLVDDVVTTGATMKAARAALAPHLPPDCTIVCLAIAH